jgi:ribosomal protein S18 acetylase RimI-like enzyme
VGDVRAIGASVPISNVSEGESMMLQETAREGARTGRFARNDVRVVELGADRIEEIRDLWIALHERHCSVANPKLGQPREPDESWELRRARYLEWLEEPSTFVLVAEQGGRFVAYTVVRELGPIDTPSWYAPDRRYEIESLCVTPDLQGARMGKLLIDAIKTRARENGIQQLMGSVIGGNLDAVRFYEREGGFVSYITIQYRFEDEDPENVVDVPIADETTREVA